MKRVIIIAFSSILLALSLPVHAQEIPTVEIGQLSTTHILFATDLTYVDISRPDVVAFKVVSASKNVLALKAKAEFSFVTTVTTLENNGTMHTLKVRYDPFPEKLLIDTRGGMQDNSSFNTQVRPGEAAKEPVDDAKKVKTGNGMAMVSDGSSGFLRKDAPTLEEIMRKDQQIYHIGDKNFNVELYCTNIFVYGDLTYLVLTLYNNTDIGFDAGDAQFNIENAKADKKRLSTDKSLWAKSSYGSLSCPPRSVTKIGYTISKLTLLKNECLKVYVYERSGNRNLILSLSEKDINYAVSPK